MTDRENILNFDKKLPNFPHLDIDFAEIERKYGAQNVSIEWLLSYKIAEIFLPAILLTPPKPKMFNGKLHYVKNPLSRKIYSFHPSDYNCGVISGFNHWVKINSCNYLNLTWVWYSTTNNNQFKYMSSGNFNKSSVAISSVFGTDKSAVIAEDTDHNDNSANNLDTKSNVKERKKMLLVRPSQDNWIRCPDGTSNMTCANIRAIINRLKLNEIKFNFITSVEISSMCAYMYTIENLIAATLLLHTDGSAIIVVPRNVGQNSGQNSEQSTDNTSTLLLYYTIMKISPYYARIEFHNICNYIVISAKNILALSKKDKENLFELLKNISIYFANKSAIDKSAIDNFKNNINSDPDINIIVENINIIHNNILKIMPVNNVEIKCTEIANNLLL